MELKTARGIPIKELRKICQSSAPNPAMETLPGRFTRIFSIYLTKLWLYTPVTPNWITAISAAVFFASAFVYFGPYWMTLFGPLLYIFSIFLDGNDGEVARFRELKSKFGGSYVEPVSHDLQYGFFFLIVAVGLYAQGETPVILIAGALASVSKLLYRSLTLRFWHVMYHHTPRKDKAEQLRVYHARGPLMKVLYFLNKNIFTVAGTLLPLTIATVAGRVGLLVYLYAVGYTVLLCLLMAKQFYMLSHSQSR